jgi:Dullard-like phosphatase family protein
MINRYLALCEQALQELFKLNQSADQVSGFLVESLHAMSERTGELRVDDFNRILKDTNIRFDSKGIADFTPELLLHDPVLILQSDIMETKPSAPFLRELPVGDKRLTLILDLDETLIHYPEEHIKDLDFQVVVEHVKVRPHALEFLQQMAALYEVGVFTAASQSYADPIIDFIDPKGLISHRLFRQHLTLHNGKLVKDLSKVGRSLNRMIMVDNLPENFILQPENGVYIKSWMGDENDRCLLLLLSVFVYVANNARDDVRNILQEFKTILVESIK